MATNADGELIDGLDVLEKAIEDFESSPFKWGEEVVNFAKKHWVIGYPIKAIVDMFTEEFPHLRTPSFNTLKVWTKKKDWIEDKEKFQIERASRFKEAALQELTTLDLLHLQKLREIQGYASDALESGDLNFKSAEGASQVIIDAIKVERESLGLNPESETTRPLVVVHSIPGADPQQQTSLPESDIDIVPIH